MKLDTAPLAKALNQLEKSLGYLNSRESREDEELRRQFRAAVIQAFEYTYELVMRMIRRELRQIAVNPEELDTLHFMDFMRTAAESGIIREAPPFKFYREKRNLTTHTYEEDEAEEVLSIIDSFIDDVHFVLKELKRRNP